MKTMINLLPPAQRRQQMLRTRALQWCVVLTAMLVCCGSLRWWKQHEYRILAQQLQSLEREHRPTRTMLRQLIDMRERLADLRRQESIAKELENQRLVLTLLGAVGQSAEKTEGRLRLTSLQVEDFQFITPADTSKAADTKRGNLLLSGLALDNSAVAELLGDLQGSGLFARVELIALKQLSGGSADLREYEMRCEF